MLLTSNSLFWRKQTSSIWFGDREMQTFREKTYTRNNSFMNYQQIYSFNQWNDWEEDTFLSTLPENNLKICYRLQNIASLVTERTQLLHPKKIFPLSSPFYRMWRHFSLDDHNTKNVPGVVECSPPPLVQSLNSPFFPPHIGAEPGRAKEESRITCMRMLRTNRS